MARQPLSRATLDEFTPDSSPRRSSGPVYSVKENRHTNNDNPNGTCCGGGGGGHHGCNCGCKDCVCRFDHFRDVSNSQAYGGQGGSRGMPRPGIDLPDPAARLGSSSSSVRTADSRFWSNGSFDNSFEARGHFGGHHTATQHVNGVGHQFAAGEEEEEDGHDAFRRFLSPADSLLHMSSEEEDSSGMLIPGLMDDSTLAVRGSGISIDERSMLDSEYERSFTQPSATTSQVLTGTGAAHEHHFLARPLRLTPECRHDINNPICARCAL